MKTNLRYIDSSTYWRQRASRPGQKSVLWKNEFYNNLFREEQRKTLNNLFYNCAHQSIEILEYGCGIGEFCKILADIFPNAHITGIDFAEMIAVAQERNPHPRITYMVCEAENYKDSNISYNLIVSSGCITSIIDKNSAYAVLQNITHMLAPEGKLLFIDPFHKFWPLSRKSILVKELITELAKMDIKLDLFSGISFWPIRIIIANSAFSRNTTSLLFSFGEKILHAIGTKFWSDYKVLLFSHDQT